MSTVMRDTDLSLSFPIMSLSHLGVGAMSAQYGKLRNVLFFSIFWKSLYRAGIISPLNVWWTSSMELTGQGIFFVGRLLTII